MKYFFAFVLFFCLIVMLNAQKLVTYEIPKELQYKLHNDDYTVKVRIPGGEWLDLYEYNVEVDLDNVQNASMVSFDFEGKVEISIKKNNGIVNMVQVRPISYSIIPKIENDVITFILSEPCKLSVEFNRDRLHNLHIFANSILKEKPNKTDTNTIYFGPGLHEQNSQGNAFHIKSNHTVYIDGGAILKGKLVIDKAENVKIIGRGTVFQAYRGIEIINSNNITIDGPIFINPEHYTVFGGQSNNIVIRDIKSFSCKSWSDGIDLMACSDVTIENVFMRNSDDCIAIYGHRWEFFGSSRNYTIQNSVLWADIAHPINMGLHGNALNGGDTIENIRFNNIDILEHDEDDRNYQGCMAISCTDSNLVRNISFNNIRVEDFQEGQIFNFRVYLNGKYSKAPGRGIENVIFKNILYNGYGANPSTIDGYSKENTVKNITIEGLKINGEVIAGPNESYIKIGSFAEKIIFKE